MSIPSPTRQIDPTRQPTAKEMDTILGEVFAQATLPMAVIGFDHLIKRVNSAFCELLQRTPEELLDTHILELTHPDDRRASQIASWRARRGRPARSIPKRYLAPDGSSIWSRITTILLRDPEGEPLCVLTQAEDASEEEHLRRQVGQLSQIQLALAESSEAMLRAQSIEELWGKTCRIAVERGGLQMAWVGTIRDDGTVVPDAHWGSREEYLQSLGTSIREDLPEGQGPVGLAVRTGHPAVFQDVADDPRFDPWRDRASAVGFRGVAAFSLRHGETPVGVLVVYGYRPHFFDAETTALLERLAQSLAFAWEVFELRAREERSAREIADGLARFHYAFQHSSVAICMTDLGMTMFQLNRALCALLHGENEVLLGTSLLDYVDSDQRGLVLQAARALSESGKGDIPQFELGMTTVEGQPLRVRISANTMLEPSSRRKYLVWQAQDITAQRQAEMLAERRTAQQAAVAALGREALESSDIKALSEHCASLLAQCLGVDKASVLRWNPVHDTYLVTSGVGWQPGVVGGTVIPGGRRSVAGFTLASGVPVIVTDARTEARIDLHNLSRAFGVRSALGVPIWTGDRYFGVLAAYTTEPQTFNPDEISFAEGVAHVLGAAVARSEAEVAMQRQALHDALTGLPNRILLLDRIGLSLGRMCRERRPMAVMFLDIDRFKLINDTMGHSVGDEILRAIALRLSNSLRPSDTVARVGGDEFVILCDDLDSGVAAMAMAERLIREVEAPILIEDREVVVTASLGVVINEDEAQTSEVLLRDSDIAMYRAKSSGGRRALQFSADMREVLGDRVRTEAELHRAVKNGELVVHYQPTISLRSGEIVGAEALVRWNHPTKGMVPPLQFIPLAEETGAIHEIGAWVLREACQAARRWSELRKGATFSISVNVSARQLQGPNLVQQVAEILEDACLPASRLCVEITETAVLADSMAALSGIAALRELGVRISVDDFGTGYSSVSHLRRFQLHELKIDKSFIDGITDNPKDEAIVGGLIQLAHSVGLQVAAEGVETEPQRIALEQLGCDLAQGYLMSRPVPTDKFEHLWVSSARL